MNTKSNKEDSKLKESQKETEAETEEFTEYLMYAEDDSNIIDNED